MPDTSLNQAHSRLEHFPVTIFATVMGLTGFSLALHQSEQMLALPGYLSGAVLVLAVMVFLAVGVLYALKFLRHRSAVRAEWNHPVKMAFFPAISIGLLLISVALRDVAFAQARVLWMVATAMQAVLTLSVISGWIGKRPFQTVQMSPAWFIPAVGNVVVPVAGVSFGFPEISWLFFSAGMMFWLILLTLVFNRLVFHDPLPGRLLPTLAILIAPPAIGFLSWLQLNDGHLDAFARILFYTAIIFATITLVQLPGLVQLPFSLSFWALSFPVAALTLATLKYSVLTGSSVIEVLGFTFLAILAVILLGLSWRTMVAAMRGEICRPD
ncbi:Tellurite resistance protein TehA [Pelagimonas phthalicica]|uniref:Tellurite resistance protein TehA n=1 Tax=Pelagimonas phthalicica TaxID=1037362 RepID=A0A238JEL8_9RHOB|nr:SLAC1 anion channel family protein [Pelagimonas phthalicica]TDS92048.1 tellurite resistance protein [Pelagimonas phthalicica]SMX29098.1 Tellurite resistance protein TehA [Pelagimonas phthalicica]